MVFIIEEAKEAIIDFSQAIANVLQLYFDLISYQYKPIQYNTLNVMFSNSQLSKLQSGRKTGTEVTLKLPLNVFGDSNDENKFLHKLSLTNTKVSRLCKTFADKSSANIKLSKDPFA